MGDYWQHESLLISENTAFQIVIEGVVGDSYLGDIGIDDTSFSDNCILDNSISITTVATQPPTTTANPCASDMFKCKSTNDVQCIPLSKVCDFDFDCDDKSDEAECGTCTFESGMCGWYDSSYDNESKWTIKQAPSVWSTGPQIDHTTNSTSGSFLVAESTDYYDTAILLGPTFRLTSSKKTVEFIAHFKVNIRFTKGICKMRLWLHMDGDFDSEITIYSTNVSNTNDYLNLQSIYGPLGKDWKKYEISIGKRANHQIEMIATPGVSFNYSVNELAEIAMDDIEFIDCSVNNVPTDKSLNCDFEQDFCFYEPDLTADFEWDRDNGAYAGPDFDHTTGTGYYAFIENWYPRKKGQVARLSSTMQTNTADVLCFKHWYHMFGSGIGALNIYLDQYDSNGQNISSRTLISKKTGSKGNRWFAATNNIKSNKPWKITFEGVIGNEYRGDIAIDDLSSSIGECEYPGTYVCDFEFDFCEFTTFGSDHLIWERGQPSNSSIDHTTLTNQGAFAFVQFKDSNFAPESRLISKPYLVYTKECLEFW